MLMNEVPLYQVAKEQQHAGDGAAVRGQQQAGPLDKWTALSGPPSGSSSRGGRGNGSNARGGRGNHLPD